MDWEFVGIINFTLLENLVGVGVGVNVAHTLYIRKGDNTTSGFAQLPSNQHLIQLPRAVLSEDAWIHSSFERWQHYLRNMKQPTLLVLRVLAGLAVYFTS